MDLMNHTVAPVICESMLVDRGHRKLGTVMSSRLLKTSVFIWNLCVGHVSKQNE